jgi:hypothetical protein
MQKAMCKLCGGRHNRHEPHQFEPVMVIAQEPLIDTKPPGPPKITIAPAQTFTVAGWPTREEAMPDNPGLRTDPAQNKAKPPVKAGGDPPASVVAALWPSRETLGALSDETLMRVHNAYRAEVVRRQRAKAKQE